MGGDSDTRSEVAVRVANGSASAWGGVRVTLTTGAGGPSRDAVAQAPARKAAPTMLARLRIAVNMAQKSLKK